MSFFDNLKKFGGGALSGLLGGGGNPLAALAGGASSLFGGEGKSLLDRLLQAAGIGAGVSGIQSARGDSKRVDELRGEREALARQLFDESTPIRQRSNEVLLGRLNAGALPPPNLSGLQDTLNPFRRRFSFDLGTTAGAPPPPGPRDPAPRDPSPRREPQRKTAGPSRTRGGRRDTRGDEEIRRPQRRD